MTVLTVKLLYCCLFIVMMVVVIYRNICGLGTRLACYISSAAVANPELLQRGMLWTQPTEAIGNVQSSATSC